MFDPDDEQNVDAMTLCFKLLAEQRDKVFEDYIFPENQNSNNERREWLANRTKSRSGIISPEKMNSLEKWYGKDLAKKVKYVESFEVAEYGMQPTDKDLREFFPMLKK